MNRATPLLTAAAILLTAAVAVAGTGESAVQWTDASWEGVLKTAKEQNRHIVIDFYTTWCGPCKRMDQTTYLDDDVAGFMNANLPVKYDAEKGVGEALAAEYRIVAYPTTVLIAPDGTEIDRHLGYLPPDEFLEVFEGYIRGEGTLAWYANQVADHPDDIELHRSIGVKYADAVILDKAEMHLQKVLAMDPDDRRGWRAGIIYTLGDANYRADEFAAAKKYIEQLLDEYPDSEWYDQGLTRLARVEYELGNPDAAVARHKAHLDRHADDPKAMNGFAWFCSQRAIGLDEALPVALKAAELSGRDPGILDTLAEVYYAMGNYDKALEIGKEALAQEPDDTYFKDQVEKYRKAREEAGA